MERRKVWKLLRYSDLEEMHRALSREVVASVGHDKVYTMYAEIKQEMQERDDMGVKDIEETL